MDAVSALIEAGKALTERRQANQRARKVALNDAPWWKQRPLERGMNVTRMGPERNRAKARSMFCAQASRKDRLKALGFIDTAVKPERSRAERKRRRKAAR